MEYDVIIVGAGFAGAVTARRFAEDGKKVLVLEKRRQIGGNAYDWLDENKVMRHEYGPHIFHTNSAEAVSFLSRFTEWYPYEHRVLGYVKGKLVPIPFNLTSIEMIFPEDKAERLKQKLVQAYGMEKKVPILELRKNTDPEILELADFIFENVFQYYTMKQWGLTVEEIDPAVTARVPVLVSYDDRYFQNTFQKMPREGYTAIFRKMLKHPNIEVRLSTDALALLKPDLAKGSIQFEGADFQGPVIYTGLTDALFGYSLGELPYRSLNFDVQTKEGTFQKATTVNYPTPETEHAYTRITEYKHMMQNEPAEKTTIAVEYPLPYDRRSTLGSIPYYPVFTAENQKKYAAYKDLAARIPNLHLLGRLAEYRYYDMDAIVARALEMYETIK